MNEPTVSIVIPVYNRFELLHETVESILSQTFTDFELLLVDDFSTDGTRERLAELVDPRVSVQLNECNLGAGATRNRGIDLACGEYIALTDQDDLWHPEKLARQVELMRSEPELLLVGTHAQAFSLEDGVRTTGAVFAHAAQDELIREFFFYSSPFVSSTVLIRRSVLTENNLRFRTDMGKSSCEDYDLWRRISQYGKVGNVPEVLLDYREHASQQSRLAVDEMTHYANVVRKDVLNDAGIEMSDENFAAVEKMGRYEAFSSNQVRSGAKATRTLLTNRTSGSVVHREMLVGTLCRTKTSPIKKLQALFQSRAYASVSLGMIALYVKRLLEVSPVEF